MKEQELRKNFSNNLIYYRKASGMTQLELATLLNYSDKAVSKWERGESLPDVYTLTEIARVVGVTPNDLISERIRTVKHPKNIQAKIIISLISIGLVWVVDTLAFVILNLTMTKTTFKHWLVFIYAIPVSSIILIVFSSIWKNLLFNFLAVSTTLWTVMLSIYLTIITYIEDTSVWLIFLICVPLEVITALWFLFLYNKRRTKIKARKRFFDTINKSIKKRFNKNSENEDEPVNELK